MDDVTVPADRRDQRERRAEPRTPHAAIVIMAYGDSEALEFEPAELLDCSPGGVAILFHRPLATGRDFLLKLKLDRVTLVSYTVRSCAPVGAQFRIGARFSRFVGQDDLPPEAAFAALLAS